MGSNDVITIKEYFNEKFIELKASISELKQDIRTNQTEMQNKVLKMEDDIDQRIIKIEQEMSEFLFLKKYWKVFAVTMVLFGLTTLYTVKKQFDNANKGNASENVVRDR